MATTLKIGLDASAPVPLHTDFRSGKFEGFEVDLIGKLCSSLGYYADYTICPWKHLLQKLRKGELDLVCSAVTITPERQQYLEFSVPYLTFRLCAGVRRDNLLTSIDSLHQKRIGVRVATEGEKYIRDYLPENEVMLSDSNDELYKELTAGTIDCVINDSPIASSYLKHYQALTVGFFLPDSESSYGIAMKKGHLVLKQQIDQVIADLISNGEFPRMVNRWFPDNTL